MKWFHAPVEPSMNELLRDTKDNFGMMAGRIEILQSSLDEMKVELKCAQLCLGQLLIVEKESNQLEGKRE